MSTQQIVMTIVVEHFADGRTGVGVDTVPFDLHTCPDHAAVLWVGINRAVTKYLNENGFPTFDSLKTHMRS